VTDKIKTEDVDFYNPHDTLKREAGVYLDYTERVHAEENRAAAEDREPDFDNLPAGTGTPLVTREELPARPLATVVEPFQNLPVATSSPNAADDDQVKAAADAQQGVRDQVNEARLESIQAQAAADKAAADVRVSNAKAAIAEESEADALTSDDQRRSTPADMPKKRTASKRTAKKATAKK
jgi:hypothetical protein